MNLDHAPVRRQVEAFLGTAARASLARIARWEKMPGGAIQQNLAVDVELVGGPFAGQQRWVLRTDAASQVASSRNRAEEFALLTVAHAAGVKVPRPYFLAPAAAALPAYFVMARVDGIAAAHRLTKAGSLREPARLARELGANLARIHAIRPPQPALAFLGPAPAAPTRVWLEVAARYLDHWRERFGGGHPALEWGLAWWRERAPAQEPCVLVHRDYRTGNYLVDEGHLAAVLDWEFAGWGNPLEDLGWFCARCWRFAGPERVAGGIADAADFLAGYNEVAGTSVREGDLLPWQALAQLRWAIIALQQAERHLAGGESSLELALTGRLLPELELELLRLTAPAA